MARGFFFLVFVAVFVFFGDAKSSSDSSPSACHCRPMINVAVDGSQCDMCAENQKLQQEMSGLKKELETVKNRVSQIKLGLVTSSYDLYFTNRGTSDYVIHHGLQITNVFSICFRVRSTDKTGNDRSVVSYSLSKNHNELLINKMQQLQLLINEQPILAVLRDPVVCRDGHTMCEKCLETAMFKGNGNCPIDRNFMGIVKPVRNLALQSMLLKLIIKCPNESGCSWTGCLENLQQHKKDCPMEMVNCSNVGCSASLYRYEIGAHLQKCPHKTSVCQLCNAKVKTMNVEKHKGSCPKMSVECPNKCSASLLREQVIAHLMMCNAEPFACPFHCGIILKQGPTVKRHFTMYKDLHLDAAMASLMEAKKTKKLPLCQRVDSALFEWKLEGELKNETVISPPVPSKLVTTSCGLKRTNNHMDLYIFLESNMGLTTLLTSGMAVMKTKSGREEKKEWKEELIKPNVDALRIKDFACLDDVPNNGTLFFAIHILM